MTQTAISSRRNGRRADWPLRRSRTRRLPTVHVADVTGPLDRLADHDVLTVADCQNLDIGAANLNVTVQWRALADLLRQSSRSVRCHAFVDDCAGSDTRATQFTAMGWQAHVKTARTVRTRLGWERKSNVDNLLAFYTGLLASRSSASLVLICSGDGELVEDLAEALAQLPISKPVATLSLSYSTASRLDSRSTHLVDFNIELGMDCLDMNPGRF